MAVFTSAQDFFVSNSQSKKFELKENGRPEFIFYITTGKHRNNSDL